MKTSKKYQAQISEHNGSWSAAIMRRVTAQKSTVSKQQHGFASEADAQRWAGSQLAEFHQHQSAKNKRNRSAGQ